MKNLVLSPGENPHMCFIAKLLSLSHTLKKTGGLLMTPAFPTLKTSDVLKIAAQAKATLEV